MHTYTIGATGKIEFSLAPASVLLAHRSRVMVISLSRAFSIACSGDSNGVLIIWDLNRYAGEDTSHEYLKLNYLYKSVNLYFVIQLNVCEINSL